MIIDVNIRILKNKPIPIEAGDMSILKSPREIMQWGLDNLVGMGRVGELGETRRKLLPLAQASRTYQEGIRVSYKGCLGIYYDCPAIPDEYFEPGQGIPLITQIDGRSMDYVYTEHPDTRDVHPAYLSKRSKEYQGKSWEEGADYQLFLTGKEKGTEKERDEQSRKLNQSINATCHAAVEAAKNLGPITRSSIINGIEENRKQALSIELGSRQAAPPSPVPPVPVTPLTPDLKPGDVFIPPEELDDY
jgi:hypothetical protein